MAHRRPWTHAEVAYLRSHYATSGRAEIGRRLGRHAQAVGEKARRLGIGRSHFRMTAESLATLVHMTEQGHSEISIAAALGTNYRTVRTYRIKAGVRPPPRQDRPRYLAKVAANTAAQCEREGCRALVEIRWLTHRVDAVRRGYPPEVTPAMAAALDAIRDLGGAATRAEIATRLGIVDVDHHTTGRLARLGLVTVSRNERRHDRAGPRLHVYRLAGPGEGHRRQGIGRGLFVGTTAEAYTP